MSEKKYDSSDIFIFLYIGLVIGMLSIAVMTWISPTNVKYIVDQICNIKDGYTISYKYNSWNYDFDSIVCRNAFGLQEVIIH